MSTSPERAGLSWSERPSSEKVLIISVSGFLTAAVLWSLIWLLTPSFRPEIAANYRALRQSDQHFLTVHNSKTAQNPALDYCRLELRLARYNPQFDESSWRDIDVNIPPKLEALDLSGLADNDGRSQLKLSKDPHFFETVTSQLPSQDLSPVSSASYDRIDQSYFAAAAKLIPFFEQALDQPIGHWYVRAKDRRPQKTPIFARNLVFDTWKFQSKSQGAKEVCRNALKCLHWYRQFEYDASADFIALDCVRAALQLLLRKFHELDDLDFALRVQGQLPKFSWRLVTQRLQYNKLCLLELAAAQGGEQTEGFLTEIEAENVSFSALRRVRLKQELRLLQDSYFRRFVALIGEPWTAIQAFDEAYQGQLRQFRFLKTQFALTTSLNYRYALQVRNMLIALHLYMECVIRQLKSEALPATGAELLACLKPADRFGLKVENLSYRISEDQAELMIFLSLPPNNRIAPDALEYWHKTTSVVIRWPACQRKKQK